MLPAQRLFKNVAVALVGIGFAALSGKAQVSFSFEGKVSSLTASESVASLVKVNDTFSASLTHSLPWQPYWSGSQASWDYSGYTGFDEINLKLGNVSSSVGLFATVEYTNSKTPFGFDSIDFDLIDFMGSPDYVISWDILYLQPWDVIPDSAFGDRWDLILTHANPGDIQFRLSLQQKVYDDEGNWSAGTDTTILTATGLLSSVSVTGPQQASPVPEPTTYGVFGVGLGLGIIGLRMRKRVR